MIQILHYTNKNPFLNDLEAIGAHDLSYWSQSNATLADTLIEYAGRVCYHSTDRMGNSKGFITDRLREGHEDIIEHASVTICYEPQDLMGIDCNAWPRFNRYIASTQDADGLVIVTANLRAWLQILANDQALMPSEVDRLRALLQRVSPQVFGSFADPFYEGPYIPYPAQVWRSVGQAKVTLLAANYEMWGDQGKGIAFFDPVRGKITNDCVVWREPNRGIAYWDQHGTATFLIEGVSRAFSHQMVRYRKNFSYSQESQRYVDLAKGQWQAIIPPAIANNPQALDRFNAFCADAEQAYADLRGMGIRKEDSRFLLLNATETRMVVSGSFDAWKHFLWQRALDKAAQWEIRHVGQAILKTLWGMAPDVFDREMDALIAMPGKDKVKLI